MYMRYLGMIHLQYLSRCIVPLRCPATKTRQVYTRPGRSPSKESNFSFSYYLCVRCRQTFIVSSGAHAGDTVRPGNTSQGDRRSRKAKRPCPEARRTWTRLRHARCGRSYRVSSGCKLELLVAGQTWSGDRCSESTTCVNACPLLA
jgi:hypothetical protein